ncbi:TetR/AcrR family transcriptional regulator [uncultured Micrococcus sp.]|uniref:TetR/AcrR family transcriptional regulator n=1 Tax=uncultured Micrococcus sp. TaxID=114051 RepID=UPI00130E3C46|nr:TetR/AcrR family transcriptional regulator [uncultured Micrococcus sp.]
MTAARDCLSPPPSARRSCATPRENAKAQRRQDLLDAATRLFADRGFDAVRLEDIGAASGISGPGVYRHFAGKQAVLAQILQDASTGLLDGGTRAVEGLRPGREALQALVEFHAEFSLRRRDVIRVQDRDVHALEPETRRAIVRVQRAYIDLWARHVSALHPDEDEATAVFRVQAVFGLLNSTPRSVRRSAADVRRRRPALTAMAWAALGADPERTG